jgi:cell division protein FtsI (penicillin-binding protein 3)
MFVALTVFLLIGVGFVAVLVDLQAVRPDRYRDLGEDQRLRTTNLAGYRGSILDRDGFVLASSTPGQELVVDPQLVEDPDAMADLVAPILGVEPASLMSELTPSSSADRYGRLAAELDEPQVAILLEVFATAEAEQLRGLVMRPIEQRIYPADRLAVPIVGKVDPDEQGISGIEWQFDELMQGHGGVRSSEVGAFGSITGGERSIEPPTEGHDVVLTIDHRIQYVVEQALIEHCEEMGAASANSVVTDPRTGEILAMATVSRSDNGACVVPGTNQPLVDTFEPGSVLKLVTLAGAVEELGYTGASAISVPPSIVIEDKKFVDHPPHPPADFPVTQIMADSMNVGTIKLAEELGPERLYDYLSAFGFGQETGIGFRYEALGTVRTPDEWYGSDRGSIAIGQGITANSVQLISAYNAIANDGVYLSPTLVRSLVGPDGEPKPLGAQVSRQVVSERTANEVTAMLTQVVETGTGTAAAVPGYSVAGKTGTAWKVFQDGPYKGTYGEAGARHYVVTFAGFLPAENPELSIIVVV